MVRLAGVGLDALKRVDEPLHSIRAVLCRLLDFLDEARHAVAEGDDSDREADAEEDGAEEVEHDGGVVWLVVMVRAPHRCRGRA